MSPLLICLCPLASASTSGLQPLSVRVLSSERCQRSHSCLAALQAAAMTDLCEVFADCGLHDLMLKPLWHIVKGNRRSRGIRIPLDWASRNCEALRLTGFLPCEETTCSKLAHPTLRIEARLETSTRT
jgi:hypothetical protein